MTNHYFYNQVQYSAQTQRQHTAALQELTNANFQHNYCHMFASMFIYDGTNRGDFSEWLDTLEATCIQSRSDIYAEGLGKLRGSVQGCLLRMPQG